VFKKHPLTMSHCEWVFFFLNTVYYSVVTVCFSHQPRSMFDNQRYAICEDMVPL